MDTPKPPDSLYEREYASNMHPVDRDNYFNTLKPPSHKTLVITSLLAIIILIVLIYQFLVHRNDQAARQSLPVPVIVSKVHQADVPVYLSALGTVTPIYNVTVKTQINGQLIQVFYKEGQLVKTGDFLAMIDQRPYLAQLTNLEGQLMRDEAILKNANIDLNRYTKLYGEDSISEQILETQKALVRQYEGIIKSDQGQIEVVKVNLEYCRIISPIDGRVGLRLVDPGNFVQTTDTNGLVIINTIQPITVIFSIPEDNLPKVLQQFSKQKCLCSEAYDRDQNKLLAKGKLISVDNQIDPTTGTVKLKAEFNNEDYQLFPNQFVNIRLLVDTLKNALTVPTPAVQQGANGNFVYLLNKDKKTVSVKPVIIKEKVADIIAITGDLSINEMVVIEGSEKLREGAKVIVTDHTPSNTSLRKS